MNSNTISNGILKAVAIILGIALLLYFLYQIQSVISYIAIAAVISLIGRPIVLFLEGRLKFTNTIAVIVSMVLLLGLFIGVIGLFIPLVMKQGQNLSLLNIEELQVSIENLYIEIINYFDLRKIDVEESIKDSDLMSKIDYSLIPDFLNYIVSGLGSFSVGLFSVLFISFFFLKDSRLLLIVGVENAIVIAFLCALLNLIPYVGPLIGAFLMLLLTMTSNLGQSFSDVILPKSLWVLVVFGIGQLVDNFGSQPIIFSKSVKSHPLEIFLIILTTGILFGVIGLIIAVPAYTAIKVILKEFLSENKIVKKLTKDL